MVLFGVLAVSSAPSGKRAVTSGSGRESSSILPSDVQCAVMRRPSAGSVRTACVESTLAM
ncbi:hypothetical protein SVIOM342S_00874 [Streptomyces violaceorubidus]